mgnify:FL=1
MIINGGEFGFIDRIRQWIGADGKGVALGIGDDAAVLLPPPGKLLAACDMLVEGVHFEKEYISPWQLGWKALAVNISDIAAMGGVPLFALVSMGLADWVDDAYVEGIYRGMLDIAERFGVELVGGDTVRSPQTTVVNITILGSANSPVTRSGACPGHLVAVTGYLGRSAAGLAYLQKMSHEQKTASQDMKGEIAWIDELIKAHLEPMPRIHEGRALAATGVISAMMDISDGLAGEAHHIAGESKVGVVLREDAIPISESTLIAAESLECDPLEWALSGGEDFELVFTFPPESTDTIRNTLSDIGGSMYVVGHITPMTEGIVLIDNNDVKRNLLLKGYDHFSGKQALRS